jgi:hypothetical protein
VGSLHHRSSPHPIPPSYFAFTRRAADKRGRRRNAQTPPASSLLNKRGGWIDSRSRFSAQFSLKHSARQVV